MSRLQNSIKNSKYGIFFYVLYLILSFFSRKIFLDHLGVDLLGLNTLIQSILGFLNLAELGMGAAIAFALYKPLHQNERNTVTEIISIQGYLFKRIGFLVLGAGIITTLFFPLIFEKSSLPLWYAYATFYALFASSILSFFINYKLTLFDADQKNYIVTAIGQGCRILKIIFQIFALIYLPHAYIFWLLIEFIFAIMMSFIIHKSIQKHYPWLDPSCSKAKYLLHKYPLIISKTKQIFFHKIGGFVLQQTSPIIIYSYLSLGMVGIYGNYALITTGTTTLLANLFNGINASIGNLVAEGNKQNTTNVFWELQSSRLWICAIISFGVFYLSPPFIELWVGREYLIDSTTLLMMTGIVFALTSRTVIDAFISAHGRFGDIASPLIEASLNIGLSLLLGYYWGLKGILAGVFISLVLVILLWKPYYLFKNEMEISITTYFANYFKLIGIIAFCLAIFHLLPPPICPENSWGGFLLFGAYSLSVFSTISFLLFYICCKGMRNFTYRIYFLIKNKWNQLFTSLNENL